MRSFERGAAILAATLALVGAGCGDSTTEVPDAAAPAEDFACQIGVVDTAGAFHAATVAQRAELVLGFQGFLWFDLHLSSADTAAPTEVKALLSVELSGEDPFNVAQASMALTSAADGTKRSGSVHVFVTGRNPDLLAGSVAKVGLRLEAPGLVCKTTGELTLVDDDDCVHTNDEPCDGTDIVFEDDESE